MDISLADSPVPTGQTYVYEEYGTPKIFHADTADGFTYVPQNDLRPVVLQASEEYDPRAGAERVKVGNHFLFLRSMYKCVAPTILLTHSSYLKFAPSKLSVIPGAVYLVLPRYPRSSSP